MKYTVSTNETQIVFVDAKGKAERIDFIKRLSDAESMSALRHEIAARHNATQATLSILVNLMDTAKLDSYKGKTPANEGLTKEFKVSCREIEVEYLKPLFCKPLEDKGAKPDTIQNQWALFIEDMRKGGVWSNVSATVRQYFAIVGKLPCVYEGGNPDKSRLLSTHAMQKEIANLRTVDDTSDKGIAGKLVELMQDVENRTEKTKLGEYGAAIAALKAMLATFEGLDRESQETAHKLAVSSVAQADIDKFQSTSNQVKATDKASKRHASIADKAAKAIAKANAPALV